MKRLVSLGPPDSSMRGSVIHLAFQMGGVRLRGGKIAFPRTQLVSSRVGICLCSVCLSKLWGRRGPFSKVCSNATTPPSSLRSTFGPVFPWALAFAKGFPGAAQPKALPCHGGTLGGCCLEGWAMGLGGDHPACRWVRLDLGVLPCGKQPLGRQWGQQKYSRA